MTKRERRRWAARARTPWTKEWLENRTDLDFAILRGLAHANFRSRQCALDDRRRYELVECEKRRRELVRPSVVPAPGPGGEAERFDV